MCLRRGNLNMCQVQILKSQRCNLVPVYIRGVWGETIELLLKASLSLSLSFFFTLYLSHAHAHPHTTLHLRRNPGTVQRALALDPVILLLQLLQLWFKACALFFHLMKGREIGGHEWLWYGRNLLDVLPRFGLYTVYSCVCVYTFICMYMLNLYIRAWATIYCIWSCVSVCIYIDVRVYLCVCVYMDICMYMYTHNHYIYTPIHPCTPVHTHMYTASCSVQL